MLSFQERSQVTILRLRRCRNEISFASPRGSRVSRREGHAIFSFLYYRSLSLRPVFLLSSLFQFSLRFEENTGRDTPPGSLTERFRHGTILFRLLPSGLLAI